MIVVALQIAAEVVLGATFLGAVVVTAGTINATNDVREAAPAIVAGAIVLALMAAVILLPAV